MKKKAYEAPTLHINRISLGEFCASCANTKIAAEDSTWGGTIRNINQAGYRTLRTIEVGYEEDYVVLSK